MSSRGSSGSDSHQLPPWLEKVPLTSALRSRSQDIHLDASGRPLPRVERLANGQTPGEAAVQRFTAWENSPGNRSWKRDRDTVDIVCMKYRNYVAITSLFGTFLACLQHELVVMEYDPRSQAMDMLKALCLLSTIITLLVTYRLYILSELFERLVAHLTQLMTLDEHIPLYHPLSNSDFWMEVLIILPVCPPFFTAEIGIINWDNFVLYRIETVLAMWSTIRFYRGWQSIRDYVLVKLPKRHTVAAFDHLSLGSAYAFKVMMKGNYAAPFIIVLWGFSICLSSYWFRLSESTACLFKFVEDPRCEDENAKIWGLGNTAHTFEKVNDPWIWNAMWIMWATASSVGYGDFAPTTHAGRVIAVVVSFVGVACIGLLTASMAHSLSWTPEEVSALMVIDREKGKIESRKYAARIILRWLQRKNQRQTKAFKTPSAMEREKYLQMRIQSSTDLEDCMSDEIRVDAIFARTQYLEEASLTMLGKIKRTHAFDPAGNSRTQSAEHSQVGRTESLSNVRFNAKKGTGEAKKASSQKGKFKRVKSIGELSWLREAKTEQDEKLDSIGENLLEPHTHIEFARLLWERLRSTKCRYVWRHHPETVEARINTRRLITAVLSLLGAGMAVLQNEMILRNEDPESAFMNLTKAANSIITVLIIIVLYQVYWHMVLWDRIINHQNQKSKSLLFTSIHPSDVLALRSLWLEWLVCAVHVPPWYTDEWSALSVHNLVAYRMETVGMVCNILRCYLTWWLFQQYMVSDLPMRHAVTRITTVPFGHVFALKRAVNDWNAVTYLTILWGFFIVFFAYLFRSSEITACLVSGPKHFSCEQREAQVWLTPSGDEFQKINDQYIWNAAWFIVITMTTVGYGDISPDTNFGRFIAFIACFTGILFASLITAALANLMRLSSREYSGLSIMAREKARIQLREVAVDIIILRWKVWKGKRLSWQQMYHGRTYQLSTAFEREQTRSRVEVQDCMSLSGKIERISRSTKVVAKRMNDMAESLWRPVDLPPPGTQEHRTWHRQELDPLRHSPQRGSPPTYSPPRRGSPARSPRGRGEGGGGGGGEHWPEARAGTHAAPGSGQSKPGQHSPAARARAGWSVSAHSPGTASQSDAGCKNGRADQGSAYNGSQASVNRAPPIEPAPPKKPPPGQNEEVAGLIGFTLFSL